MEDANSSEKKDKQEVEKEASDESKASAQAKEKDDDDDSVDVDDDSVDDDEGASSNEKKQKPSKGGKEDEHEGETPANDIQKLIAENCTGLICGGGLAILLLISFALCFCCYRCCCAPKKVKVPAAAYTEVELSNGYKDGGGSAGYKDEFVDEDNQDDAEYGVTHSTSYEDI